MLDVFDSDAALRFTGHETFPLRLLWLKKAYDAVRADNGTPGTFQEQSAIARFGVGRNMVLSMRYWAVAVKVLTEDAGALATTPVADLVLHSDGLDPYLEQTATLWLFHSRLVEGPAAPTTFDYAYNHFNRTSFTRDDLVSTLFDAVRRRGARASKETIKRDVEVFMRSYAGRAHDAAEDAAEPLFAELGLIREGGHAGEFEFVSSKQQSLPDGIFLNALRRFWMTRHPTSPTLSVELLTYSPGSPGRMFKLNEDGLVERLMRIGSMSAGCMEWTDTAGLRQVALRSDLAQLNELDLIRSAYGERVR